MLCPTTSINGYFCSMKALGAVNPHLWRYKKHLLGGLLFVVLSNYFGVLPPRLIGQSIDLIAEQINLLSSPVARMDSVPEWQKFRGELLYFAFLVIGLSVLKGVFMFFMRQTIIVMSRRIEFDQKNELYAHFQKLSRGFYQRNRTGDLMARISEDVGKVRMYTGPGMMYAINMVSLVVVAVGAMLRVNAELTFYVLIPLPVLAWAIFRINKEILLRSTSIQQQLGTLNSAAQEMFSGIRLIRACGLEPLFRRQFDEDLDEFRRRSLRMSRAEALFFPLILLLIGLSTIITVYVGGLQVEKGLISTGNIAEFVIYVNMLTWPVTSLGWVASMVQQAEASQTRINQILKEKPEIDSDAGEQSEIRGEFRLDQVSYWYPGADHPALHHLNLSLKPGETLGVIGRTGAGKSTLVELLLRLVDPSSGTVWVDDRDLKSLHPGHYRSQLGYVPQDVFLFSDTMRNNLLMGNPSATPAELEQVLSDVRLDSWVNRLPDGLDTLLGERGVNVSGGQKQRIAIARVLLKRPNIFILDDCLSALDADTERHILRSIRKATRRCTTLLVSHRISTVAQANQIIVLDEGKLIQHGTHASLSHDEGLYKSLFERQQNEPIPGEGVSQIVL
ncbi:MAG: ABC transporter ATP-binding protein [Sphingomonadales bacterium]|nr:ABC transporter ATP-binding protein [Sphingomonadales bacterium]